MGSFSGRYDAAICGMRAAHQGLDDREVPEMTLLGFAIAMSDCREGFMYVGGWIEAELQLTEENLAVDPYHDLGVMGYDNGAR